MTVEALHDVGAMPSGTWHIDMLGGGRFEGPRLACEVLPGGMDQKLFRSDGAMNPKVRLVLKSDDGKLIYMHYTGMRYGAPDVMARIGAGDAMDPSEY